MLSQPMILLALISVMMRYVDCRCGYGEVVVREAKRVLEMLMGGAASQVIIWNLERRTFSGERIHQRPEDFFKGLESVLGPGVLVVAMKMYYQMSGLKELKNCRFLKFLQRRFGKSVAKPAR